MKRGADPELALLPDPSAAESKRFKCMKCAVITMGFLLVLGLVCAGYLAYKSWTLSTSGDKLDKDLAEAKGLIKRIVCNTSIIRNMTAVYVNNAVETWDRGIFLSGNNSFVKIRNTGEFEWQRDVDTNSGQVSKVIAEDMTGEGFFAILDLNVSEVLIRMSKIGEITWRAKQDYPFNNTDTIIPTSDGGCIVQGLIYTPTDYTQVSTYVVRYDSLGKQKWNTTIGNFTYYSTLQSGGFFYLGGQTYSFMLQYLAIYNISDATGLVSPAATEMTLKSANGLYMNGTLLVAWTNDGVNNQITATSYNFSADGKKTQYVISAHSALTNCIAMPYSSIMICTVEDQDRVLVVGLNRTTFDIAWNKELELGYVVSTSLTPDKKGATIVYNLKNKDKTDIYQRILMVTENGDFKADLTHESQTQRLALMLQIDSLFGLWLYGCPLKWTGDITTNPPKTAIFPIKFSMQDYNKYCGQ